MDDKELEKGQSTKYDNLSSLSTQYCDVLDNIRNQTKVVKKIAKTFLNKITSDGLGNPENGISFLEVKNLTLLSYMSNLVGLMKTKTEGSSIVGSDHLDQLVEHRVVLEKMKPIEHKLKYHIDKLLRSEQDSNNALNHKANLDDIGDDDEDYSDKESYEDESKQQTSSDPGVYVPPKIAPEHFDEEDKESSNAKVKKRQFSKTLIREMQEELLDTPVEVHNRGDSYDMRLQKEEAEKQRYEEAYMTRLPVSKKQIHRMKSISTIGVLGDEITDFSDRKRKSMCNKPKKNAKKRKLKKSK